jgi:hypothetical protein
MRELKFIRQVGVHRDASSKIHMQERDISFRQILLWHKKLLIFPVHIPELKEEN